MEWLLRSGVGQKSDQPVCISLTNTLEWRSGKHPKEFLHNYVDILTWARKRGAIPNELAVGMSLYASEHPSDAEKVLSDAKRKREMIYRIFSSLAHHLEPNSDDVKELNEILLNVLTRVQIAWNGSRFVLEWNTKAQDLNCVLWEPIVSAADLLISVEINRVKECANEEEGCGFLFLDESKNLSRKWCSMAECGNRSKARRFQQKQNMRGREMQS